MVRTAACLVLVGCGLPVHRVDVHTNLVETQKHEEQRAVGARAAHASLTETGAILSVDEVTHCRIQTTKTFATRSVDRAATGAAVANGVAFALSSGVLVAGSALLGRSTCLGCEPEEFVSRFARVEPTTLRARGTSGAVLVGIGVPSVLVSGIIGIATQKKKRPAATREHNEVRFSDWKDCSSSSPFSGDAQVRMAADGASLDAPIGVTVRDGRGNIPGDLLPSWLVRAQRWHVGIGRDGEETWLTPDGDREALLSSVVEREENERQDEAAWRIATEVDTWRAYAAYIDAFVGGRYETEARIRYWDRIVSAYWDSTGGLERILTFDPPDTVEAKIRNRIASIRTDAISFSSIFFQQSSRDETHTYTYDEPAIITPKTAILSGRTYYEVRGGRTITKSHVDRQFSTIVHVQGDIANISSEKLEVEFEVRVHTCVEADKTMGKAGWLGAVGAGLSQLIGGAKMVTGKRIQSQSHTLLLKPGETRSVATVFDLDFSELCAERIEKASFSLTEVRHAD